MVAHLRGDVPPLLRQVYWAGFSNPCCSVSQPFYLHGPKIPDDYANGTSTYSADAPWWWANRIKLLCDLNYRTLNPRVRQVFNKTEMWEVERQKECEANVKSLLKEGKKEAAVACVQEFINHNGNRVEREYRQLNITLPVSLQEVGIEYLFTEYLADWALKAKVPLPVPSVNR